MAGFTRWMLGHKLLVALFWVLVTAVGALFVSRAIDALSFSLSAPGQEGFEANRAIARTYGINPSNGPIVLVNTLPDGMTVNDPAVQAQLAAALDRIQTTVPGVQVLSYLSTGDRGFVSRDGRTSFAFVFRPVPTTREEFGNSPTLVAVKQLAPQLQVAGTPLHVTGMEALSAGATVGGNSLFIEVLIASIGALIVLAVVFGSFIAVTPLVMAIISVLTTFMLVWGLTSVTDVSFIIQYLVALIGIGVGIDYALLIVVRWREERASGHPNQVAVMRAMESAGRAIIVSGTAVAIGLLAMIIIPIPFIRSVGIGGVLIPLVSVAVALTLLPVALATIGPRIDWPRLRTEEHRSRPWSAWAELVVRRRWIAAAAATLLLGTLLVAAATIRIGSPAADAMAGSGDAHDGVAALERSGIGTGPLSPVLILVTQGDPVAVTERIAEVDGVRQAFTLGRQATPPGGPAFVIAVGNTDVGSAAGQATIREIKQAAHAGAERVAVGGSAAETDFLSAIYDPFPLVLVVIALITFLLLARAFRSLLLPLKAVLLNIFSVGATLGVLVLVWQMGYGSQEIWGITATGAITSWVPLFLFAFLFGLSMDYEVFILARMREEYDATGSTRLAVVEGIGRTARLVTSAGLVLIIAFASLATAPNTDIKIMGSGLAAGIFIDATIVRSLLVPALVSLFGHWNWWLPPLPARLLRVKPSLPAPEPGGEQAPGTEFASSPD